METCLCQRIPQTVGLCLFSIQVHTTWCPASSPGPSQGSSPCSCPGPGTQRQRLRSGRKAIPPNGRSCPAERWCSSQSPPSPPRLLSCGVRADLEKSTIYLKVIYPLRFFSKSCYKNHYEFEISISLVKDKCLFKLLCQLLSLAVLYIVQIPQKFTFKLWNSVTEGEGKGANNDCCWHANCLQFRETFPGYKNHDWIRQTRGPTVRKCCSVKTWWMEMGRFGLLARASCWVLLSGTHVVLLNRGRKVPIRNSNPAQQFVIAITYPHHMYPSYESQCASSSLESTRFAVLRKAAFTNYVNQIWICHIQHITFLWLDRYKINAF